MKSDAGWISGHDGGMALFVKPDAYGEVQSPAPIGQPGAFTISTWVVVRTAPDNGRIFANSAPGIDPGFELAHEKGPRPSDGRTSYFSLLTFRTLNDGGVDYVSVDSQSITLGTWYHLAVTHDGTNAAIYVNGDLHDQKAVGARRIPTQPVYIGRRSSAGCCFLDGYVDELRYYDRVLPQAGIRALAEQ